MIMFRYLFVVFFCLSSLVLKAQNNSIIYKSFLGEKRTKKDISPKLRAKMAAHPRLRKAILNGIKSQEIVEKLEFKLIYNDTEVIFKAVEILIDDKQRQKYRMAYIKAGISPGEIYYKDKKEKYRIKSSLGELIKIKYPPKQYDWKITKETKEILGYTCYKAIATYKKYDYGKDIEMETKLVAWFTNKLAFSYGPLGIDGLPGIVLEGIRGSKHFKAIREEKDVKFPNSPKTTKEMSMIEFSKEIGEFYKKIKNRRK